MIYKEFVLFSLSKDWKGQEAIPVCRKILSFIADNSEDRSSMMTYSTLAAIAGYKSVNGAVVQAATILTTYFNVLDVGYTFVDEFGAPFYLEEEDIRPFLEGHGFAHPDTGEAVEDPSASIYPYFIGNRSTLLQEIET